MANIERDFEVVEKAKRAAELILANIELDFQCTEREKRAAESVIANFERAFQNDEKEKRAAELMVANAELLVQNNEKEKQAAEVIMANHHQILENICKVDPVIICADKQRIEQVMINLISNAIKYSSTSDRIIISISPTSSDVVVSAQYFDLGIPDDQQPHLFSRFYRVKEVAPHISGLGIGLYISDDIISRHNGILGVESSLGKVSTFSFRIPK